jgi:UDP-galactopyranose mutase
MHPDLICFSHLRWNFVFQRPNHFMSRAARDRRVLYVEEPLIAEGATPRLENQCRDGVEVLTPHLPAGLDTATQHALLRELLDDLLDAERIERPVLWYYTPMALAWTAHLDAAAVVYDCMDHLAGFRGAPADLLEQEARLIARADLLLTGGARLHSLKKHDHANAHCFPSSVDAAHFRTARRALPAPDDQAAILGPRVGYTGVIDERLDLSLIGALAEAQPDWSIVLVGPIAKIDEADIPAAPNIHRLGMKGYGELPAYLSGWDAALMPFAHNEATAYISPTKTPEYLAAGLPVASTAIHDVVEPYGRLGLVEIGDGADGFIAAARRAMATDRDALQAEADAFLAERSWDRTWAQVAHLLDRAVRTPVTPLAASRTRFLVPAGARQVSRPTTGTAARRLPAPARSSVGRGSSASRPSVDPGYPATSGTSIGSVE